MPAFPNNSGLTKTEFDAGTDNPVNARAQLEVVFDKLLAVIDSYAAADGICDLDVNSQVPLARLLMAVASGICDLDASVEVPMARLKTDVANGVSKLDASVKVPVARLYRGVANGLCELDAGVLVPVARIPSLPTSKLVADNGIDTGHIAAAAIGRSQIANSTTTSAGAINWGNKVYFILNDWALFPMIHVVDPQDIISMAGHNSDGGSASSPRFGLKNRGQDGGSNGSYDVDHRWIIAA